MLPILWDLPLEAAHKTEDKAKTFRTYANPQVAEQQLTQAGEQYAFSLLLEKYHWDKDPDPIYHEVKEKYSIPKLIHQASGSPPFQEWSIEREFFRDLGLVKPGKSDPIDWADFDKAAFQGSYVLPHELDEMTLNEILVCTMRGCPKDEVGQQMAAYRKLTDEQKRELSIRKIARLLS